MEKRKRQKKVLAIEDKKIDHKIMLNRPVNYKEPHTYKDLCTKKYSTVPNHDGSVPGEKQSIFVDTKSHRKFKNTKAEY